MAVSDRDKKIIYILLIIMVIFLPYFFYIKNSKAETQAIRLENEALQKRYDELQAMNERRKDYEDQTADMNKERDAIIARFPGGIHPANYTLFLLEAQTIGGYEIDEESGMVRHPRSIWFESVNYGETIDTAISSEETDTGYTGLTNVSTLTYATHYKGLKFMLQYLMEYENPMMYKNITMEYDAKIGQINGTMLLSQYAITGPDRPELETPEFVIERDGGSYNVDIDDMELRGNTNEDLNGVFGPVEDYVFDEEDADAASNDDDEDGADAELPANTEE